MELDAVIELDAESSEVVIAADLPPVNKVIPASVYPMMTFKPDTKEELDDWLKARKGAWREIRDKKKRERNLLLQG